MSIILFSLGQWFSNHNHLNLIMKINSNPKRVYLTPNYNHWQVGVNLKSGFINRSRDIFALVDMITS